MERVPAAGPRSGLELAAVDGDALAHPDETVAAALRLPVGEPRPSSLTTSSTPSSPVADDHLGPGGVRVLHRVRQAFLDEAVGGEVDAGRQLGRVALDLDVDREAGLARLLDEPVEVLEARLRRERGRLLRPAEDADEPAHLGERLASGLLDDQQRLSLPLLFGPQEPADARRLNGHDADAWPTTSWSSRAMRARSSATAARASSSRLLEPGRAFLGFPRLLELAAQAESEEPDGQEEKREKKRSPLRGPDRSR